MSWRRLTLAKILAISGSPAPGASTDILLGEVATTVIETLADNNSSWRFVKLNELIFQPCQACGFAPDRGFCVLADDLTELYKDLAECDLLLFGSPLYFDTVSGQAKTFIDRCNCFRPADFDDKDPEHDFLKLLPRKRPGAMVLVGGERGWFEGARRIVAGFFKWVEVVNEGVLEYRSDNFHNRGSAAGDKQALEDARKLGRELAEKLKSDKYA